MYSDEQLMVLLRSQNQADINRATDCLYHRYFTAILYLVRGNQFLRLDDRSFATDIFFESVKGLINKVQTVEELEGFNLGGYFRGIVKYKFLDAAEKEKKRIEKWVQEDKNDKKDAIEQRDADLEKTEKAFIAALTKSFNALKDTDKYILCLHLYVGLKEREIFEKGLLPDLSYGNIRQRYSRACERLRESLAHFNMHQLSDNQPIDMKNLCVQYQNHTDNE